MKIFLVFAFIFSAVSVSAADLSNHTLTQLLQVRGLNSTDENLRLKLQNSLDLAIQTVTTAYQNCPALINNPEVLVLDRLHFCDELLVVQRNLIESRKYNSVQVEDCKVVAYVKRGSHTMTFCRNELATRYTSEIENTFVHEVTHISDDKYVTKQQRECWAVEVNIFSQLFAGKFPTVQDDYISLYGCQNLVHRIQSSFRALQYTTIQRGMNVRIMRSLLLSGRFEDSEAKYQGCVIKTTNQVQSKGSEQVYGKVIDVKENVNDPTDFMAMLRDIPTTIISLELKGLGFVEVKCSTDFVSWGTEKIKSVTNGALTIY